MKLIYSNESSILVGNIKNLLQLNGIEVTTKNEFANGAVGDLSAFDAWIELWVPEKNVVLAQKIIQQAKDNHAEVDWFCPQCKEPNGANFETCWHCQHEPQIYLNTKK